MFFAAPHEEKDIPVLQRLIHEYPLGVITTAIPSEKHPLILSSHIPWVLDVDVESNGNGLGRLRGHIARQNPQSKVMMEVAGPSNGNGGYELEQEVLVLFTAAPHHYVTPKWYIETKPVTAKVVPTWNYAAVQAYGKATIYFDTAAEETSRFLGRQMHDLSEHTERSIMDYTGKDDRPGPWKVTDAPERYIEIMKKNVIGIEIVIDRLQGKFKMSQEMRVGDRMGVVEGFARLNSEVGNTMANIVKERSDLKEAAKA
ncbi:hypothetical protein JDV02_000941 [Purpureocillium takamizusanense]|uniref:Transcriptional regulator n=1 Tax=Purpureocillium takamizusanense TaxID=2060973 RepID=A0A9Q8V6Y6_9HYPO|nr:uncharacterized protein JDV02_000941 [Purpureocillium takamizusanense]UNI14297.1 hypothetical protein JDV02_000941 [Purpureocillium takamizusanense]